MLVKTSTKENELSEQVFTNCTTGGPVYVHVKDGKVLRIRPLVFDETDAPSWTIEAQGKKFTRSERLLFHPTL